MQGGEEQAEQASQSTQRPFRVMREHCAWGQGNWFYPWLSHLLPERLWEKFLASLSFYLCICNQRL